MSLYQDASAYYLEKTENRNGILWSSILSIAATQAWWACGAQNKACFQLWGTSRQGNPEQKARVSLRTCPFRRPGENWDTHISCSGLTFPTVYTLAVSVTVRPKKRTGKNILRTKKKKKKSRIAICYFFFPFRFKVIRTYWKIIHDYPSHLWSVTSYLYSMRRRP